MVLWVKETATISYSQDSEELVYQDVQKYRELVVTVADNSKINICVCIFLFGRYCVMLLEICLPRNCRKICFK